MGRRNSGVKKRPRWRPASKDVFYGYDRYNVSDNDGVASLTVNAGWLKENLRPSLKISGHCDERDPD